MSKILDKTSNKAFKILLLSILIYIVINTFIAILLWYTGENIPWYLVTLFSLIPAVYFYRTKMANKEVDAKIKFNWRILGLSILLYYIIIIWLNTFIFFFTESSYKIYSFVIALIFAFHFYHLKKEHPVSKKDMLWIGIIGLLTLVWFLLINF